MGNTMLPLHPSQQAKPSFPAKNQLQPRRVFSFPDTQVGVDDQVDITELDIMELVPVVLDQLGEFPKRIHTAPLLSEAPEQLLASHLLQSPRL